MITITKNVKKENLKFAYATAMTNFSEAIQDYLLNLENAPDPSVTKEQFEKDMDILHDTLFGSWLSSRDAKVKHSVLEAIGKMMPLITEERLTKQANNILNTLISTYKKTSEPFYVTQCIYQVIEVIIKKDPSVIEPVVEPLLTALFTQMCSQVALSSDFSKPMIMKNNSELLRCYDVLIKCHKEKLIHGLIVRMNSEQENYRLASLTAFKHILNSSKGKPN